MTMQRTGKIGCITEAMLEQTAVTDCTEYPLLVCLLGKALLKQGHFLTWNSQYGTIHM